MEPGAGGSRLKSQLLRRQRSGGSRFKASPGRQFSRPYLEKPFTKKGLVEWLKVKALSSNSSTAKNNNKKKTSTVDQQEGASVWQTGAV
jgi:hypothetical protein